CRKSSSISCTDRLRTVLLPAGGVAAGWRAGGIAATTTGGVAGWAAGGIAAITGGGSATVSGTCRAGGGTMILGCDAATSWQGAAREPLRRRRHPHRLERKWRAQARHLAVRITRWVRAGERGPGCGFYPVASKRAEAFFQLFDVLLAAGLVTASVGGQRRRRV